MAWALTLLVLAGCGAVPPAPTAPTAPTPTPTQEAAEAGPLSRFTAQQVTWMPCDEGECADVEVPLDYADPGGATLRLAVAREVATKRPRLGVLFINPGGPGASGRSFATWFDTTGLEGYDVVGWDPRGVEASEGVTCLTGAEADAFLALDPSPDSAVERDALAEGSRRFGAACRAQAGTLLDHLSVADSARDLDVLRAVLGEERLTYYGASYGSALGAVYAGLFPERVGRLVLDAGVSPDVPPVVSQSVGFDRALARFAAWCDAQRCPAAKGAQARVEALLNRLDAAPLRVGDRLLTQGLAASGVASFLYGGKRLWPFLGRAVQAAEAGNGALLLTASDELNGRRADGSYGGLLGSFLASSCADGPRPTRAEADARWASDRAAAPVFGYHYGPAYTCIDWPSPAAPAPVVRGGGTTPPVVVIGGEGDPATPYEWSVALADALASGVLVTRAGEGHVSYGTGSSCVDAVVRRYLSGGVVPADGTRC